MGTHAEKIFEFLRGRRSKTFCDDCIAELLGIKRRQQVNSKTEAFGLRLEFTKKHATCSHCKID